jgi:hypothetical protein
MWPFKKKVKQAVKPEELLKDLQPTLCSTYVIQWNYAEDLENEAIFADNVPLAFDAREAIAIQAEVEFSADGTYKVGHKTLVFLKGAGAPFIVDVPYNEFKKYWQEFKTNEAYNEIYKNRP